MIQQYMVEADSLVRIENAIYALKKVLGEETLYAYGRKRNLDLIPDKFRHEFELCESPVPGFNLIIITPEKGRY